MKLSEALILGHDCGMKTVGEAMNNVAEHLTNIFAYDDINDEINELNKDLKTYNFDNNKSIIDALQSINPEYHQCHRCGRILKPEDPAFMCGAEGVDGEPETWYTCPTCQIECPCCGNKLVDGFYKNIPAYVCPECNFFDFK